jgi:hypothetical protein
LPSVRLVLVEVLVMENGVPDIHGGHGSGGHDVWSSIQ